jgi:hypothetical protein
VTTTLRDTAEHAQALILEVLVSEHHPRPQVWITLALPVELAHIIPDALTSLMLDGKLNVVKSPNRPDRYRLT